MLIHVIAGGSSWSNISGRVSRMRRTPLPDVMAGFLGEAGMRSLKTAPKRYGEVIVQSPLIDGLSNLRNFEQAFGKAGIYTSCDVNFPADGILAAGEFNDVVCIVGELDLELLQEVRESGSVTPLKEAQSGNNFPILISHF